MSTLIKIRFLKNIGHYIEGQEIEVSQDQADALCAPRERHNGTEVIKWQAAISLDDLNKLHLMHVQQGGLSLDEARALGLKNIAVDPNGPGPIEPARLREVPTSDEASFSESKSADEGKSAKAALELNSNNPVNKKKG